MGIAQAVPILNASDPEEDIADMSREDTRPSFTKATLDITHYQPLVDRLGLRIAASGQIARVPLPSSEEFSIGGARYGRGYNAGEITGEDGVAVSAELEYDLDLAIPLIIRLRPYGFYDFAKAWDHSSSSSTGSAISLASAGFGLRVVLAHGATMRLEYARPLTRRPSNQTGDKQDRITFFTGWRF